MYTRIHSYDSSALFLSSVSYHPHYPANVFLRCSGAVIILLWRLKWTSWHHAMELYDRTVLRFKMYVGSINVIGGFSSGNFIIISRDRESSRGRTPRENDFVDAYLSASEFPIPSLEFSVSTPAWTRLLSALSILSIRAWLAYLLEYIIFIAFIGINQSRFRDSAEIIFSGVVLTVIVQGKETRLRETYCSSAYFLSASCLLISVSSHWLFITLQTAIERIPKQNNSINTIPRRGIRTID